ncbi:MAG: maleylacetoacetate isomerase [Pseudomonadota bacterium]
MTLKLYSYWRSSAAYRLRIALALKGLEYETVAVNIAPAASEQVTGEFRQINPQMRVPVLEAEGIRMAQSMAILEWIEETYPAPPLLPDNAVARQQVRAFADVIACDVHPLNNLSVLQALRQDLGADDAAVATWYADWIRRGFTALESVAIANADNAFLFGSSPGLAEVCLIPQIYNARRFGLDLGPYPRLVAVDTACLALPAFQKAGPENQPDAPRKS